MNDGTFHIGQAGADRSGFTLGSANKVKVTVPHSARVWNYWLGGKDHYPIDQFVGDELSEIFPAFGNLARQSRYFLARTVRYLAEEQGIRQFLDIGAGLPAVDNTHEIAQRAAPASRIFTSTMTRWLWRTPGPC